LVRLLSTLELKIPLILLSPSPKQRLSFLL
jgi:hypothetical protein